MLFHYIALALRLAKNQTIAGGYDRESVEAAIENVADQLAAESELRLDADKLKDDVFER